MELTLRSSGAPKTLSYRCYKHIVPPGRRMAGRIVALAIALSFIATLVPIASASRDKSNTMPCCVVNTAGHCDSGLTPKKIRKPTSEPMCGLDNSESEDDLITIVAEPAHSESHHSQSLSAETSSSSAAAQATALSQTCRMDCGACASVSSRQQKREKGIAQTRLRYASPLSAISRFENLLLDFLSNENWPRINPRGPPASC